MKRKLIRILLLLLCLLMPAILWRAWLAHDVGRLLANVRNAGLPTNGEEVDRWYPAVPSSENAALVITQALALRRNFPDNRSNLVWDFKLPAHRQPLSPEQVKLLSDYVEMNAPAMEKAREAVKLPKSRYPIDCSFGYQTLLPHLAELKGLAQMHQYKALLEIQSGHAEEASACIETTVALARTLDNEPCLISQLVRVALLKYAVGMLERRLNASPVTTVEASNLEATLETAASVRWLGRALCGERGIVVPYFRTSREENPKIFAHSKDPDEEDQHNREISGKHHWALKLIGYYDLDLDYFLRSTESNLVLANLEPPASLEADTQFARAGARAKKRGLTFSGLLLPPWAFLAAREAETAAHLRLALTAIEVEQFRNQNGRLPEKLQELTPAFLAAVPEDPFSGMELNYLRKEKGYVLYSVDRDGMDDGGREKPEHKSSGDKSRYDLTFILER